MSWLLRRLREPSTWRGLVWLATVVGMSLRPDQVEAIVTAGMALAGLLGVFLSDEPRTVRVELPPIALQGRSEADAAALGIGAMQSADGLRVSADRGSRPAATTGADTPQQRSGFGDRD